MKHQSTDAAEEQEALAKYFKDNIIDPLDPGAVSPKNPMWMGTDFGDLFPPHYSCYDRARVLRDNSVLPKKVQEDHEYSCCYFYFSTKKMAHRFCDRLAKFFTERKKIALRMGLEIQ